MCLKVGHSQTPYFHDSPSGDTAGWDIIISMTVPSSPYPVMVAPIPAAQPRIFYTNIIVMMLPNSSSAMRRHSDFCIASPKTPHNFMQLSVFCVEVSKRPKLKKPNWMTDDVFSCKTTIYIMPLQVGSI